MPWRACTRSSAGQTGHDAHHDIHHGPVGVLRLAPREGLGVRDDETRARYTDRINRFRIG